VPTINTADAVLQTPGVQMGPSGKARHAPYTLPQGVGLPMGKGSFELFEGTVVLLEDLKQPAPGFFCHTVSVA
jgi:hypothetical protein